MSFYEFFDSFLFEENHINFLVEFSKKYTEKTLRDFTGNWSDYNALYFEEMEFLTYFIFYLRNTKYEKILKIIDFNKLQECFYEELKKTENNLPEFTVFEFKTFRISEYNEVFFD